MYHMGEFVLQFLLLPKDLIHGLWCVSKKSGTTHIHRKTLRIVSCRQQALSYIRCHKCLLFCRAQKLLKVYEITQSGAELRDGDIVPLTPNSQGDYPSGVRSVWSQHGRLVIALNIELWAVY